MTPLVSIIIPVHNEEKTIGRVLDILVKQIYPNFEVIVVDDNSIDKSAEAISNFNVRYVKNEKNLGLAKTINRGLRLAKGDLLGVLHADCIPVGEDWLSGLVPLFKDKSTGAVTSIVDYDEKELTIYDKIFIESYTNVWRYKNLKAPQEIEFVNDKCDLYRRELFEKLGLFDEGLSEFSAGEDLDISFKIRNNGYKIILNPATRVVHLLGYHQNTLMDHFKKSVTYAVVDPFIYKKYGYSFRLGYFFSLLVVLTSFLALFFRRLDLLIIMVSGIFILIHRKTVNHIFYGILFGSVNYSILNNVFEISIPVIPFIILTGIPTYYLVVSFIISFGSFKKFKNASLLIIGPPINFLNTILLTYGFIKGALKLMTANILK